MTRPILCIITFFLGFTLRASSEPCPWINTATAAGLLKADVLSQARLDEKGGGTCTFKASKEDTSLRVEVTASDNPAKALHRSVSHCHGKAESIVGIGNEAFVCPDGRREQIIGRVRDRVFTITVMNPQSSGTAIFDDARSAASQVAGNLY